MIISTLFSIPTYEQGRTYKDGSEFRFLASTPSSVSTATKADKI